jgi:YgiT-type zinc finger domain-containing protein
MSLDMERCTHQRDESFPRPCSECGKDEVRLATIVHDAEIKHDGRMNAIHIPELQAIRCGACGEVFFTAAE